MNQATSTPLKISFWDFNKKLYIGVDDEPDSSLCFHGNNPPVRLPQSAPGASIKPLVQLPPPPESCTQLEFTVVSDSALTEHTQFAISINDTSVEEPTLSECGRFTVDPLQAYGLTPEQVQYLEALNYQAHVASMKLDPIELSPIMESISQAFTHALKVMGIGSPGERQAQRERG